MKTHYQALNIDSNTYVGVPTNVAPIGELQVSMMAAGTITFKFSDGTPAKVITADAPRDFIVTGNVSTITSDVQVVMS